MNTNINFFQCTKPDYLSALVLNISERLRPYGTEGKDTFFAQVQEEVRKELAQLSERGRQIARGSMHSGDRGSAANAVGYGVFKNQIGGSVAISQGKGRKESQTRPYQPGRQRTVSARTQQINTYYGRDRSFILRFLNSGTIERQVTSNITGRGSKASWGNRGSIKGSSWFEQLQPQMEAVATRLGITIEDIGNKIVEEIIIQSDGNK